MFHSDSWELDSVFHNTSFCHIEGFIRHQILSSLYFLDGSGLAVLFNNRNQNVEQTYKADLFLTTLCHLQDIDGLEVIGSGKPFTFVTVCRSPLLEKEEEDKEHKGMKKENL